MTPTTMILACAAFVALDILYVVSVFAREAKKKQSVPSRAQLAAQRKRWDAYISDKTPKAATATVSQTPRKRGRPRKNS